MLDNFNDVGHKNNALSATDSFSIHPVAQNLLNKIEL